jgi:hypothetical protein
MTSPTSRRAVLAGFAVTAAVALGSFAVATDLRPGPTPAGSAADGIAPACCSRPLDQDTWRQDTWRQDNFLRDTWRIKRLTEALDRSRAAAAKNPLLLADVGYYEAELAASVAVP